MLSLAPNVVPLSERPMQGTAASRSLDPPKATTASECLSRPLERRGWPGLSLFLNSTTVWTGTGQRATPLRIETLAGKTIGFLTNEQWQAHRMLPLVKELIASDFPSARVLAVDAFPSGNAEIPKDSTAALVQQAGVDAAIIGNAS